jgi:hypothetical protein
LIEDESGSVASYHLGGRCKGERVKKVCEVSRIASEVPKAMAGHSVCGAPLPTAAVNALCSAGAHG